MSLYIILYQQHDSTMPPMKIAEMAVGSFVDLDEMAKWARSYGVHVSYLFETRHAVSVLKEVS